MGGAVSSGRDNNELIDNLMGSNYIRTRMVERVFRSLDRADYMTPEARDQAYKDLAWRNGPLHMSAPCIYSEVLEGLELRPGLSFLNIGSGTGYFSTLVGLVLGSGGINHGVEVHPYVVEYSIKKLGQFIENSPTLDEFDFCEPKFYCGNGLCVAPLPTPYDRVYCGAGCPEEYQSYFKLLIKVGGVLVMPLNDNLVQIKRNGVDEWSSRNLLNVSFATLKIPTHEEAGEIIKLEEQTPARLQVLARAVVRGAMRAALLARHPHLREPPARRPPPAATCPRRICIPIEDDSDVEGLNALHDLDHVNGANEMNALLSLVLSMGQNRVAGALRFDSIDSPSDSSADEAEGDAGDGDDGDDGDDHPDRPDGQVEAENQTVHSPDCPLHESRPIVLEISQRPQPGPSSDTRSKTTQTSKTQKLPEVPDPEWLEHPERPLPGQSPSPERQQPSPLPDADDNPECSEEYHKLARSCRGLLTFEFQDERRNPPQTICLGGPSTSSDAGSSTDTETRKGPDSIGVPAEVEIYLGKDSPGTSHDMEWKTSVTQNDVSTSEDETTETSKELKRKKLDSGIGEGTTTSSGSSPVKSESIEDTSDGDLGRSDNLSDEIDDDDTNCRRRLQKRGRGALGGQSASTSGSGSADEGAGGGRRRCKRRAGARPEGARPRRGGADARRVRLSILMKRGVKELPLPYALKKYVNLGRCFEF
ncbi:uncharacterized protein LOC113504677 [Trichoplusia ni]|uniref:Uncharacterized protein LOC113504677 n=1 Tax=Trichoplusia ni TaxID=7111 RepID=A0A7E5WQ69_TRINI|nr:uncharacterized protein LOC113504677 [Trichoplusia ni]